MAITIPGVRIDGSAGNTGVSELVQPRSGISEVAEGVDVAADIKIRKETRDADAYTAEAGTELLLESQELMDRVINETEDPNEITNNFIQGYNDLYNKKLESAPNAIARRKLNDKAIQYRKSLGQAAIGAQADAVQAVRLDKFNKSANALINNVRSTGNLQLGQVGLEELYANMESTMSVEDMINFKNSTQNELKTSYLDRQFEEGDLNEVKRAINDEEFAQDLEPRQVDAYRKAIKREREKAAKIKVEQKAKNPIAFYQDQYPEALSPLDFGNPQNLLTSIEKRVAGKSFVEAKEGVELPLLTSQESKGLVEAIKQQPLANRGALMAGLTQTLPEPAVGELASQVYAEDPAIGTAMSLANDDVNVANSIMRGAEIYNNRQSDSLPGAMDMPSISDFEAAVSEKLATSVPDLVNRKQISQAGYFNYVGGLSTESFSDDSDGMAKAIEQIIGEPVEVGVDSMPVLSFRSLKNNNEFLDEGDFEDELENLTNSKLKSMGMGVPFNTKGEEYPSEEIADTANLVTVGDGLYYVQTPDGRYLLDEFDGPYVLDLKRYHHREE